jgi:hypothetical protein
MGLIFVTGPGGAGTTTVAAALALALERRGPVLRAGLGDGEAAAAEYLALALPGFLARRITASPKFGPLVAAMPGLRELMAVGKVAHEARRRAVVVDAPSALVAALRMPAAAAALFGGRIGAQAEGLVAELGRARVLPVTTAEEPAVDQTLALVAALAGLGVPVGPVVVNRVHQAPALPELPAGAPALAEAALRCGRAEASRAARDQLQLARLPAARVVVPFRPDGLDRAALLALGVELCSGL